MKLYRAMPIHQQTSAIAAKNQIPAPAAAISPYPAEYLILVPPHYIILAVSIP